jgi:aminoglycoside phosphotransferase (APT) family kinase protein
MERVRGVILRQDSSPKLDLSPDGARRLSEALVDTLAELHGVDVAAAGLDDLGKPEGYVERQVQGWARRYQGSRTDDVPEMEAIGRWLAENLPPEQGAALIHNDFKYDNLVLDPDDLTSVRAVLDWEMATLGDPLMDLGTTLGYWVEAGDPAPLQQFRFGPTHLPGSLDREGLARRYSEQSGRDLPDLAFYYVFGLFKIAVIVQQIYYRYVHGHTRDPRFASLLAVVKILGRAASGVVNRGRM